MHKNILSKEQEKLLPLISAFSENYYLVGGTAVALYLGHRNSIDFDLFTNKNIKRKSVKSLLEKKNINYTVLHEAFDQLHLLITGVKITFFNFPFNIKHDNPFEQSIMIPSLLDLAAMKAFALGGRAKWKDYVDMYFIMKYKFPSEEIEAKAEQIFEKKFNKKLFRQQLAYFNDIDYSEPVVWMSDDQPSDEEIKTFLINEALKEF